VLFDIGEQVEKKRGYDISGSAGLDCATSRTQHADLPPTQRNGPLSHNASHKRP